MKKIGLLTVLLIVACYSYSIYGATYTWNASGSASWAVTTNWTPTRTTPATTDVLQFNSGTTVTVTNIPTQTIAQLFVSGSTVVNFQANAAATILTIGGGAGTDLTVDAGSQLNINGTLTMTITIATGATGSISGTMTFSAAAQKITAVDASGLTFQTGSSLTQGASCSGNIFGASGGTNNSVVFASGSTFIQTTGSNPFANSAPASIVVFQTGSLFSNQQTGTPSFSGRTYANFEQDLASAPTITVTGASAVSIDNFTVKNGTFNFNMTGTASAIKGNISVFSGATLNFNPLTAGTVTLSGTGQTLTITGTWTIGTLSTIAVTNHPVLVIFNGAGAQTAPTAFTYDNLTLSGGGLKTTAGISVLGILSMEGNATASAAPTYGGSATLQYKGASSQTTGPELTASLNNLIINNPLGVNLGSPVTVTGTLTLTSGAFTIGANTLTLQNAIAGTPGNLSADATSSIVIAGSGSGINIPSSVIALNNLTLNNSNGTTLQGPLSLAGQLTLTSGLLTTTAANLLTLGIAATVSGGSNSSFVNGPVTVNLRTGDLIAPIGKGTAYRPIKSHVTLYAGWAAITAEQIETVPAQSISVGIGIQAVSQKRYFHTSISKSSDFDAQANLSLTWGSDDGVSDLPRLSVVGGDNSATPAWIYEGNAGGTTGDVTNGTVTSGSLTASALTGDFILGTRSSLGNPLPVELVSFTAASSNGAIVLSWKTAVETQNHGFDIERSANNSTWTKLAFIQGQGNSNTPKNYSYTDNSISKSGKYYYRLKQIDNDGAFKYSSVAESEYVVPTAFSLNQNFPNPFNPSTMISYSLPEGSNVKLSVYNTIGQTVKILENGYKDAGNYTVSFNAGEFSTGIYFYKIEAGKFSQVKKMLLIK